MLDELVSKLTKKELKQRSKEIDDARKWIQNAGKNGGVSAPVSKTFKTQGLKGVRIDIEINAGEAFIP